MYVCAGLASVIERLPRLKGKIIRSLYRFTYFYNAFLFVKKKKEKILITYTNIIDRPYSHFKL